MKSCGGSDQQASVTSVPVSDGENLRMMMPTKLFKWTNIIIVQAQLDINFTPRSNLQNIPFREMGSSTGFERILSPHLISPVYKNVAR